MAVEGLHRSDPAGQGFLGVNADNIKQGHGVGQIPALTTVVLADGGPFQPQLLQVFRQALDHGGHDRINGWGPGQMGFLSGRGSVWAIKNRLNGRFAGVPRMAGFGVYVACGFSMAGAVVTGVSAKRSHRASKVASVQVLGT